MDGGDEVIVRTARDGGPRVEGAGGIPPGCVTTGVGVCRTLSYLEKECSLAYGECWLSLL